MPSTLDIRIPSHFANTQFLSTFRVAEVLSESVKFEYLLTNWMQNFQDGRKQKLPCSSTSKVDIFVCFLQNFTLSNLYVSINVSNFVLSLEHPCSIS